MGTCSPPCPGGVGAPLTPKFIASLLLGTDPGVPENLRQAAVVNLTAIALAESGGRPGACNHYTSPGGAVQQVYGLWQHSTISGGSLADCEPHAAAAAAWALSGNGHTYHPWARLGFEGNMRPDVILRKGQAAKGYKDAVLALNAGAVVGGAIQGAGASLFGDPFGWLKTWQEAIVFAVKFLTSPNTWLRFGEVIAGGILVLLGLWFLFSQTKTGQSVNKTAAVAAMA